MNDARRVEAERLAVLTSKAKQERIVREFGEQRNRVINRVTLSGNAGGYLPALIAWAVKRLNSNISAQADAYIEAFNAFNLPCDEGVEKKLWQAASDFTAGSIMNVRNDRSVKRHQLGLGAPWHLEIEREMHTSAKEAIARLRHQRAMVQNRQKEVVVSQTFNAIGPNARNNVNSTDNSTNVVHQGVPFAELREAITSGIADATERAAILESLASLESARDRESASKRYQQFIGAAADYMTLIGPFLPALGHWVHNLAASLI
jgi:hypothetical protein